MRSLSDHLNIQKIFEQPRCIAFSNGSSLVYASRFDQIPIEDFSTKWFKKQHSHKHFFIGFVPYADFEKTIVYKLEDPQLVADPHSFDFDVNESFVPIQLTATDTDDVYCDKIAAIKEDILSGSYYQLNYIRHFTTSALLDSKDRYQLYYRHRPRMFSYLQTTELGIFSLSPERFVRFQDDKIEGYPIKGTRKRGSSPTRDRELQEELVNSAKDLAELAIIVDLMRHDLLAVCKPQSVKVEEYPRLYSACNVHHLEACISGVLKNNLTFESFCQGLLPSASITGAPKRRVTESILQYEAPRARDFFMGNAFYYDTDQLFDSSVLIRTFVRRNEVESYAAGSGITAKSTDREELQEVYSKANLYPDL